MEVLIQGPWDNVIEKYNLILNKFPFHLNGIGNTCLKLKLKTLKKAVSSNLFSLRNQKH